MASIFAGTELPAWISEQPRTAMAIGSQLGGVINKTASTMLGLMGGIYNSATTGENLGDSIYSHIATTEDKANQLNLAGLKQKLTAGAVDIQTKQFQLDAQQREQAAWMQDMPKISEWMQLNPEQRAQAPFPAMSSKQGMEFKNQAEIRAANSVTAQAMTGNKTEYDKAVAALSKDAPDIASDLFMSPNQFPRQENWQALSTAQARYKERQKQESILQEIEAIQRGDTTKVVVGPKGETRTYEPPKPVKPTVESADVKPQSMSLGDGTTVFWMPGAKTMHIMKGNAQPREMTPAEMLNIAKEKKDSDPDKKKLMDFLSTKALQQLAPKTNTPTASTPATQPSGVMRVQSPSGQIGTIPASQWGDAQKAGYTQVK